MDAIVEIKMASLAWKDVDGLHYITVGVLEAATSTKTRGNEIEQEIG